MPVRGFFTASHLSLFLWALVEFKVLPAEILRFALDRPVQGFAQNDMTKRFFSNLLVSRVKDSLHIWDRHFEFRLLKVNGLWPSAIQELFNELLPRDTSL